MLALNLEIGLTSGTCALGAHTGFGYDYFVEAEPDVSLENFKVWAIKWQKTI